MAYIRAVEAAWGRLHVQVLSGVCTLWADTFLFPIADR